jgi:hypothetical protein
MSGLGVLDPAGALGLAAVAALVALHLLGRRRRLVVGSLLLWRQVPATRNAGRRRFRPDLLFVLQAMLLLALVGALVRPYLAASGTESRAAIVLVIDLSASMQTREDGGSRLDLARRKARTLVDADETETMLVAAAERAHVLLGWTSDSTIVRRRLENLEAVDVAAALAPAVVLAIGEAQARPGARVVVLTDLAPAASGLPDDAVAAVDWAQVGRTDDNLALASLDVAVPAFGAAGAASATIVVKSHAHAARRTTLTATVDERPWAQRTLELPARGTALVRLVDPPGGGVLRVALAGDDALAADDVALGWIPRADAPAVVLVGDVPPALPWTALPLHVSSMSAARYADAPPAGPHVVVLDGRAAPPLPPQASVLWAPPPAGTPCAGDGLAEAAAVIDWEAGHPVVGGLDGLDALALSPVHRLVVPSWGAGIVRVASPDDVFPLLVAGVDRERRVACLGTALDASLVRTDRLPLLLMVLGTLRWLGAGDAPLVVETGAPATIEEPGGTSDDPALRVARDAVVALRTGVHRVVVGTRERLVLANLFDDRESDVGRATAVTQAATTRLAPPTSATGRHELSLLFLAAAAVLFIAEWSVWLWMWA